MGNLVQLEHIQKHLQARMYNEKIVKMCVNSAKSSFAVGRSGKLFILMTDLYIKRGPSILLFIFNYTGPATIFTITKFWKASKCSGEVNKPKI